MQWHWALIHMIVQTKLSILFHCLDMIFCVFIFRAPQRGVRTAGGMSQGVPKQINGTSNHSAMTTCLADILERKLIKDSHSCLRLNTVTSSKQRWFKMSFLFLITFIKEILHHSLTSFDHLLA